MLGLLCVKQNGAGSNCAVHFDFFSLLNFYYVLAVCICVRSHLCHNNATIGEICNIEDRFVVAAIIAMATTTELHRGSHRSGSNDIIEQLKCSQNCMAVST